jgi:hypothetical protein
MVLITESCGGGGGERWKETHYARDPRYKLVPLERQLHGSLKGRSNTCFNVCDVSRLITYVIYIFVRLCAEALHALWYWLLLH